MFIAALISRVFDPFFVFTVTTALGAWRAGLTGFKFTQFLVVIIFMMLAPLVLLLIWAVKNKKISDWDISDRRQRIKAFTVFFLILAVYFGMVLLFDNDFLIRLFSYYTIWFLGFFAITLFWKISGHTAVLTLAIGLTMRWLGWGYWPIILLLSLVAWARVKSKNHTLVQVAGGIIYSLGIMLLLNNLIP